MSLLIKPPRNVTADYIVDKVGPNIIAVNGNTGKEELRGTDSTTVIEWAMDHLTGGRTHKETVVVKGDHTINTQIDIPSYTRLVILGKLTAKDAFDSCMLKNSDPGGGNTHIEICEGTIDGNKDNQGAGSDTTITVFMDNVDYVHIHDVYIKDGWTAAIRTINSNYVVIANNIIDNPGDDCIAVNKLTAYATIIGNLCLSAGGTKSYGSNMGIEIQDGTHDVAVVGNTVYDCDDGGIQVSIHAAEPAPYNINVTGNVVVGCGVNYQFIGLSGTPLTKIIVSNNQSGDCVGTSIFLNYCEGCSIFNNRALSGYTGIRVSNSNYNHIVGNTFSLNTDSGSDILNSSHYNNLIGNQIFDNVGVGLKIAGDNNRILNNVMFDTRDGGERTQTYGIVLYAGGDNNYIKNNISYNHTINNINDAGANNVLVQNIGYVTENGGAAAAIADGGTIAHGLATTPTGVGVTASVSAEFASVTALAAGNFTVAIKKSDGSAGTAQTIYWRAWI